MLQALRHLPNVLQVLGHRTFTHYASGLANEPSSTFATSLFYFPPSYFVAVDIAIASNTAKPEGPVERNDATLTVPPAPWLC